MRAMAVPLSKSEKAQIPWRDLQPGKLFGPFEAFLQICTIVFPLEPQSTFVPKIPQLALLVIFEYWQHANVSSRVCFKDKQKLFLTFGIVL